MNKKALVLVSGGLDSQLALAFMLKQDIEVEAVSFFSHFSGGIKEGKVGDWVKLTKERFKIKMHYVFIREEFIDMIKIAKHGYGSGINPCIDCKILMFKKAKKLMQSIAASFIVTGEVLGQRPMSQLKQALSIIEKGADLEGLILRPLSAKILEPTKSEIEGIIDREKLGNIRGRGRKEQALLAKQFGIDSYPQPAGGCILTEKVFAYKMKDVFKYGYKGMDEFIMLQAGRLFRLNECNKAFLSRNAREIDILYNLADKEDIIFQLANDFPGPLLVLRGRVSEDIIKFAGALVKYYSKKKTNVKADVEYFRKSDLESVNRITVETLSKSEVEKYLVGF